MPYIRKIELKGFKSFSPKATTITLDKGFTVLTGPNGSGKTNIVDAILFGLGELSARRLRAENFSKLIFQGFSDEKEEKAKAAKVVIQLDNSDGRIPVDTSTVTISREVYKNGQSVYRLNGRRVSRSHFVDTLSMAAISHTGHNVVVQGTVTRMAEISSMERRKIIEDLVGIAQYDAEKAEAEEKLRAAEISIRTAIGRIDEVQKRIDDLERERNDMLRYGFIQNEINRFEAIKISHEVMGIERKIGDLTSKIEEVEGKVESLRKAREQTRSQRHEVEREWRKLSSTAVEEGGTRVLEVQIEIGELKAKLTELTTKINAGKASLEGLRKVRENNLQQLDTIKNEITESRKKLVQLKSSREDLSKRIEDKRAEYGAISNEIAQLWTNLGENGGKIRGIEQQLDNLYQKYVSLRSKYARSRTTMKVLSHRLNDLNVRRGRFESTLGDLKKSFTDLREVQKEQRLRLENLERTLNRKIMQKETVEKEMLEAEKIAESAKEAVVEFATQREMAETVAGEEKALRSIEEMGELGVIPGVYGRFRNLIKIATGYEQAVEVTAAGWLDSIVVQNFDVAFTCAETLKRLKLGRIKIAPIQELSNIKPVRPTKIEGVDGVVSEHVKCLKKFEPVAAFVFGDTLITKDDKVALAASRNGYRVVTVNGDLYEAGGGMESGYYRASIDFSSIIPSESAIKSLDEAVRALRENLLRRETDITTFEEEISRARVETAKLTEAISTLEGEITRIHRNIEYTARNIERIERYRKKVEERVEREKAQMEIQRAQRDALREDIRKLRNELTELRRKTDVSNIQAVEVQRVKLGDEIVELEQNLATLEAEFSTLQSRLGNVLEMAYENLKVQLKKVAQQLSNEEKEVEEALKQKEAVSQELVKYEKSKEELSSTVLTAREESKKFAHQIDEIDKQLHPLDAEYEKAEHLLNQLRLSLQALRLQLDQHTHRLAGFGFEKPLEVSPKQLEEAESSLKLMRLEMERLGAINQLALMHYAEQISRYKELSMRMNELEREKQAIISFMEEIERKKTEVFMDAFHRINENFGRYFSKLTGGGEAALKLENPENPFSGGMDIVVQFPGKPPIIISGASSGERSVAAVGFLFAIQDFMPAAFYLLDEIDAHLDAFHVTRLGELLAEESANSQFIVITLKPEMASKAGRIYGVYERSGVSHVVSTTFKEAA